MTLLLFFFTITDRAKIDTLATCYLDHKEYREGERMFPAENSCYKCLCSADFDNSTIVDNKDCQELGCGIQLRKLWKLREGCIPIYYGKACCPIDWRCRKFDMIFILKTKIHFFIKT
jgi:hypothetical protein